MLLQAISAFCLPHKPKFKDICTTTALDVLIARVKTDIIEFVLLKQIRGIGGMALTEQVLMTCQKCGALL